MNTNTQSLIKILPTYIGHEIASGKLAPPHEQEHASPEQPTRTREDTGGKPINE